MSLLTMYTGYRSILIRCSGRHHSNQGNQAETGESVHSESGAITGSGVRLELLPVLESGWRGRFWG